MKHTTEAPRPPRDFLSSIPVQLEQVVLHALEKNPEDRPADAAVFRAELLATAEQLGFEYAAVTSSPNLAALRSVGTESPSGRLVIDISRLRETRATGETSEDTVVAQKTTAGVLTPALGNGNQSAPAATPAARSFPRVSVMIGRTGGLKQKLAILGVVLLALIVIAVTLASRSKVNTPVPEVAVATPTPTPEPTPTPSSTPTPKREAKKPSPTPPKKESKGNSFMRKFKRIFKNPF
jgi:hypothetical protein